MLTVENIVAGAAHDIWSVNVEDEYHEEKVASPARHAARVATHPSSPDRADRQAPTLEGPLAHTTTLSHIPASTAMADGSRSRTVVRRVVLIALVRFIGRSVYVLTVLQHEEYMGKGSKTRWSRGRSTSCTTPRQRMLWRTAMASGSASGRDQSKNRASTHR